MKVKYTKDQLLAIESHGSNIIVSAGAGSGKTQVLTERVVHFIENHHYRLNDFLILTFTNLAAGEMKERIRQKLSDRGLEDANLVDTSYISTFDSYAFSLVKQYHFELGISANVSIIDSNIISVRKWTIIDDIFEPLEGSSSQAWREMSKNFMYYYEDGYNEFCFGVDNCNYDYTGQLYNVKDKLHDALNKIMQGNGITESLQAIEASVEAAIDEELNVN